MLPSDMHAVFLWWSVLFMIGIGFAPLTFKLFDSFFDKGYIFSKIVGLLVLGYVVFVLAVLHVAPFTPVAIFIIFFLLVIGLYFGLPQRWKFMYVLKRYWFLIACEELLFLTVLYIWAYVHSFAPDIHGLEKYMDYGFVNSFMRSTYLPPRDMWFAPYSINYYYFGHLITAMLTKLTGMPTAITFNLMLATIVAFCFTQTFSLGTNLYVLLSKAGKLNKVKLIISGLLTACLVSFAGNLHILYAYFKPYQTDAPVPFWQLAFSPSLYPNSYWYPNATRYIYHTIHEFPIYSWVVADLHGHVLDIPFVILSISLLLAIAVSYTKKLAFDEEEEKVGEKTFLINPFLLGFVGLLLAGMYMTNAWDGAIYLLLAGMVLLYIHMHKYGLYRKQLGEEEEPVKVIASRKEAKKQKFASWQIIWARDFLLSLLLVVASFFIFTTPYNINFKPFVSGIGVLCAPEFLTHIGRIGPFLFEADHCQRSYWWELLTLYGFFYFFVIVFCVRIWRSNKQTTTDIFVLLLIILSTFLIIIPEFLYAKDIYPAHYRANTMFKLAFEAFIMLSISSAYIIIKTFTELSFSTRRWFGKIGAVCLVGITIILVYLVMTYPFIAVRSYYGDFKKYQGLNGTTYLQTQFPADAAGISWLNQNVKNQPVILEAQGDSYTDYARVSSNTGLPTILGWTVHEWLWRENYGLPTGQVALPDKIYDVPAPRIEEIKTAYETPDATKAQRILKKYKVKYVFISTLEYQKYPALSEEKFKQLGKLVFQKETTKIYEVN